MAKVTKKKTAAKKTAAKAKKPVKAAAKKKPVAKKASTAKTAVKKVVKKKAPAKKTVAKKSAAKKPVAKKAVAAKKTGKKIVAKKVAVKKPAAKKTIVKKSALKKTAAKKLKAAAKKPAAKKVMTKKPSKKAGAPKKGEATFAIALEPANDDEIEAAIDSVLDEAIGEAAYGDEITFADDDAELDEEEDDKNETSVAEAIAVTAENAGNLPEQLRDAVLKVLDERQAEDIVVVPLAGRSSLADYVIIASGRASRQVAAIADYLREAFFKLGVKQVRIEGQSEANWVLVDAGDVIVHLFRPEVRSYYDVDSIWAAKHPKQ